jgi:hypothetical protein
MTHPESSQVRGKRTGHSEWSAERPEAHSAMQRETQEEIEDERGCETLHEVTRHPCH